MKRELDFESVKPGTIAVDYLGTEWTILSKGTAKELINRHLDPTFSLAEGISDGYIDPDQNCVLASNSKFGKASWVYDCSGLLAFE